MTKYVLTCDCGKSVAVEVSQAGQTIRCSCGAELEVPSFRQIRQLPVAQPAATAPASRKRKPPMTWSIVRRLLFAVGLAALVFGLGFAAYYQWGRSQLMVEEMAWDDVPGDLTRIEQLNLMQAIESWEGVTEYGLGEYQPPPFIVHRLWSARWLIFVRLGLSVALVGLILLGTAYLIPQSNSGRKKRRPRTSPGS